MATGYGTTTGESSRPPASGPETGSRPERLVPASVLLLSVWIGLTAGFLDLGSTVLQNRLIHGEFYRLDQGFPWIIPTGVTALVLLPGLVLALVARLRRERASLVLCQTSNFG